MERERRKSTLIRELLEAEKSCIIEYGTVGDMLSDSELGRLVKLQSATAAQYRARLNLPSFKPRLRAYLKERKERAANGD